MSYRFNRHRIKQLYILFLLTIFAIAVLILGISAVRGNSPDLIVSDGNGYYAWVRSIFIDRDINFQNDFEELYFPDPPPPNLNRRTLNVSLWLVNGLWGFSGDSFGSRAFIELLPPLSLDTGITLNSLVSSRYRTIRWPFVAQAIVLIVLNFYLWGGYLWQKYPQNGDRTIAQVYFWILR
jgi:hypothetical protein